MTDAVSDGAQDGDVVHRMAELRFVLFAEFARRPCPRCQTRHACDDAKHEQEVAHLQEGDAPPPACVRFRASARVAIDRHDGHAVTVVLHVVWARAARDAAYAACFGPRALACEAARAERRAAEPLVVAAVAELDEVRKAHLVTFGQAEEVRRENVLQP